MTEETEVQLEELTEMFIRWGGVPRKSAKRRVHRAYEALLSAMRERGCARSATPDDASIIKYTLLGSPDPHAILDEAGTFGSRPPSANGGTGS
jgi:hypothetical protein